MRPRIRVSPGLQRSKLFLGTVETKAKLLCPRTRLEVRSWLLLFLPLRALKSSALKVKVLSGVRGSSLHCLLPENTLVPTGRALTTESKPPSLPGSIKYSYKLGLGVTPGVGVGGKLEAGGGAHSRRGRDSWPPNGPWFGLLGTVPLP